MRNQYLTIHIFVTLKQKGDYLKEGSDPEGEKRDGEEWGGLK